jgi:hypothetical protein
MTRTLTTSPRSGKRSAAARELTLARRQVRAFKYGGRK